jgi:hypothetical protein
VSRPDPQRPSITLLSVRYGIPAALVVAGMAVLALPSRFALELSVGLTGAGLSVLLLNLLYRIGVSGDEDRDREEEARRYFDQHGRWPGE